VITARGLEELREAEASLRETGGSVLGVQADVSRPEDVARAFAATADAFCTVDVLVCNAGVQGPIGTLEELPYEDFAHTLAVNLIGTWLCMRAAIPGMKRKGYGKIITMSGGGATGPRERFSPYAASKAAVVRLTETAAEELRSFGIDVNSIAPGAVNTRMLDELLAAGERAGAELQPARSRVDSGGTPPERAAELAVFLASPASDGISGKLLSAVWDPWSQADYQQRLRVDASLATLRRIDNVQYREGTRDD
jgi:NAD(P)-dependent dehydrogenase (short-subunit alcohol dehydrogenase family)